jgi:hypothetical protein
VVHRNLSLCNGLRQRFCVYLLLALVASFLAPLPVYAQMGGYVSAYPSGTPNYFSGTDCNVAGVVGTNFPQTWMRSAQFYVGGELIDSWTADPNNPAPDVTFYETFDSTHFPDGTPLEVKIVGTNNLGQVYQASMTVPVYNKAALYGRHQWEIDLFDGTDGTPPAQQWLTQMNHTCVVVTTLGWTAEQILGDIQRCTVFYVNTHGDASPEFESDVDEINGGIVELVTPGEVQEARETGMGAGQPPFNSGTPPVNLAFVDACETGLNNAFADAFLWPFYDTNATDQAEIGWHINTDTTRTQADGNTFWSYLEQGMTAHLARDAMVDTYLGYKPQPPDAESNYVACWGDYFTRLHYVYTGDDAMGRGGWYR